MLHPPGLILADAGRKLTLGWDKKSGDRHRPNHRKNAEAKIGWRTDLDLSHCGGNLVSRRKL